MARFRCTVCGYIYDPEVGDSIQGIQAGTPFEELPEGWICPYCGAPREDFEHLGD
ncbi:MAG: rubredoxin [Candidatus Tectomicrobia bacterium]|uniref:Rubredoxin n=1 Tax=Tectimicrobiota bacterium TaxID=2528274 RepID=A0A932CKX0_UNCTE|nr:rubredoxin [Candidatus Tectomicrobia bacterium]